MCVQLAPELCREPEDITTCGVNGEPSCESYEPSVPMAWGDDDGDGCFDRATSSLKHQVPASECPAADTLATVTHSDPGVAAFVICNYVSVECGGWCTRCTPSECATACDGGVSDSDDGSTDAGDDQMAPGDESDSEDAAGDESENGDESGEADMDTGSASGADAGTGGTADGDDLPFVDRPAPGSLLGFDGGPGGPCGVLWEQCAGGLHYSGALCCQDGLQCVRKNLTYGQCRPRDMVQSTTMDGTPCGGWYSQCGGRSWTGSECCDPPTTCTVVNEFYSQCRPASGKDLVAWRRNEAEDAAAEPAVEAAAGDVAGAVAEESDGDGLGPGDEDWNVVEPTTRDSTSRFG